MNCLPLLACLLIQPPEQPPELVRTIEQQRGGRHWIDQPTDPPKSAPESLACFEVEPGCRVELVAAEPLVMDPVWIDFDAAGRMFVVEYGDYPTGPDDPNAPALSRIVVLTDTDKDGQPDQRTVFADHLRFCHSLLPLYDGILTCTDSEILFLRDTDGDLVADEREVWFDGFTPAHPQMQIGCPRRGFDNRIWLTYGPGEVRCRRPGFETETPVKLSRNDFCFDPVTMEFESVTGLGQFGNTIDNQGHRFFSTNRNPIMMEVLPMSVLRAHPLVGIASGHTDVGPAGENTRVFPLVTMKSNWLAHAGTHTSACGVTAYRGSLFSESFQHSVFACEPVGHLITRSVVEPDGAALTARRAREQADFLASTDTWFRPASLRTGPDGALYVADMYRLWVEHPKFVPPDVAAKMDWRAGDDRGRIWRVVPDSLTSGQSSDSTAPAPKVLPLALLRSSNGQQRDLGQRLIVEQQQFDTVDDLRMLLQDASTDPHTRLHALWALRGLDRLRLEDLLTAAEDESAFVRRDAFRLLGVLFPNDPAAVSAISSGLSDSVAESRLQALRAFNGLGDARSSKTVALAISHTETDAWLEAAALVAAAGIELPVLHQVLSLPPDAYEGTGQMIRRLTAAAAASVSGQQFADLAALTAALCQDEPPLAAAMVYGLDDGLRRSTADGIARSLRQFLNEPGPGSATAAETLRGFVAEASQRARDANRPVAERVADTELLRFSSPDVISQTTLALLSSTQPVEIQRAALEVIRRAPPADATDLLLRNWTSFSPSVRSAALEWLLNRRESTAAVLTEMASQTIPASAVSLDQRMKLMQNPDAEIRQTAVALFGGAVSTDRKQVVDEYTAALSQPASAEEGRRVFEKTCSRCHRIAGIGHQVGPDISDTRSRARDALLYDILDPNRRVDPQFGEYAVVTTDGLVLNGLLVAETADTIVLRQPEGRESTLLRSQIEELRATQRSLMPEGVEKDVNVQQMADLLEFLKSH